jgi:hypothetical protein
MGITSSSVAHLRRHADLAGAAASGICFVHCLFTPVAISLFPDIIPYLPGDAWFHRLLAVAIVLFGVAGFVPGYLVHRRRPLLWLVAAGMSLILAVAWAGEALKPTLELLLSVPGSLILVTTHLLNRSFCRSCRTCKDHPASCHTTGVE